MRRRPIRDCRPAHRLACPALLGVLIAFGPAAAQQTQPPTLGEILQKLEANLDYYDSSVPSLFCDEHVASNISPNPHKQNTLTDSIFRLKRVVNPDQGRPPLAESREIKTVNGKLRSFAADIDIAGPTVISGAFEGALAVVSLSQRACMNYTLERPRRNGPIIVRFSSLLTPQNTAGCLLQEEGKGRILIDPATMQITRMELNTPHHVIVPESRFYSATMGDRVLSVDYAPVQLEGQTFWLPSTITSTVTSGRGTFHAVVWSFKATYRNFHKLEVTSRVVPAPVEIPAQAVSVGIAIAGK